MEPLFKKLSQINALLILVILTAIFLTLFIFAKPAIEAYGLKFLIDPRWGVVVKEDSSTSAPSPDALPSNRQNVTSGNAPTSTSPGKGENATSQTSSTGQTPGNYTPPHSETTQISPGVPDDQINMEKEDIDLTPPPAVLEYFKTHPTQSPPDPINFLQCLLCGGGFPKKLHRKGEFPSQFHHLPRSAR